MTQSLRHILNGFGLTIELVVLVLCSFTLAPVSCAGGRLTIGGPAAKVTGRTGNGATGPQTVSSKSSLYSNLHQTIHMPVTGVQATEAQTTHQSSDDHHQDLIRVHELANEAIRWRGVKSASDLAPESQVVGVHFDSLAAQSSANSLKLIQGDKLQTQMSSPTTTSVANGNKTKQSQEFETHQEQQQQVTAGSSSSSVKPSSVGDLTFGSSVSGTTSLPVELSTEAQVVTSSSQQTNSTRPEPAVATTATTTATTTTTTTTTPSASNATTTTTTPPGWPLSPANKPTTSRPNNNSTTESPQTSPWPVGARIDREGDAVLCGEANANGKSNKRLISDRIVGGHKTEPGEFPFQVRLGIRSRRGSGICGGVVLDRWHVLTAAHCMTACVSHQLTTATIENTAVKMVVGDHSIKSDDGELEIEAETITPHEKYDACNFYANDHDIALIKTATPIPFKFTTDGYGSVNRPCLPASKDVQYKDGEPVIVSGWGVTRENSGALSNILRYVQVPVVNVTRCQETYGSRVTQDHVCAGFQAGGKDSCQGDSGGPLVRVVDNRYELVGIVSFGYGCGQAGAAGVYTRVASYLDWIKLNTNNPSIGKAE